MPHRILTLDVRADFRSGLHPCDKIQNALSRVGHGETLRLLVPFEPLPLFEVARSKGLGHEARQTREGDREVFFSRRPGVEEASARLTRAITSCGGGCSAIEPAEIVDVDARGLEPPQPMVKILEALTMLPEGGAVLNARTDRRPVHLYPCLKRGASQVKTDQQSDRSYITHIRHG